MEVGVFGAGVPVVCMIVVSRVNDVIIITGVSIAHDLHHGLTIVIAPEELQKWSHMSERPLAHSLG